VSLVLTRDEKSSRPHRANPLISPWLKPGDLRGSC
jgi:hypothetical protein